MYRLIYIDHILGIVCKKLSMYKSELENFVNTQKFYNGHYNTEDNIKFWRIEELQPTNKEKTIFADIGQTIKRSYEIDQLYTNEKWRVIDIIGE